MSDPTPTGLALTFSNPKNINFWLESRSFGQKVVPQGPFGRIKLYFEPEKCPAGAFCADQIVF